MTAIVTDTHAAIWYLLRGPKLSTNARDAFNEAAQTGNPIYLPSISFVEVIYLVEKGRLPEVALTRLNTALIEQDSAFTLVSLDGVVARALSLIPRSVVPEMPDRIIAATALSLNLPLVTRDQQIQNADITTIW